MSRTFYVNGEYVPEERATISVLDRGFLFADGVYEVSTVLGGRLIDNRAHLARLARSLGELAMAPPCSDDDIVAAQRRLIEENGVDEGLLYLQVTRGVAERDFAYPSAPVSSLVMFTQKKSVLASPAAERGLSVITVPDMRWKRRDIKTVSLLAQSMAKQAALDAGADDAWMVEDGHVTEGSSNNAWIVTDERTLRTRQLGTEILAGITRAAVMRFAAEADYRVEESPFTVVEAQAAEEAFVTSASAFVMPVTTIDGVALGAGTPGPVTRALRKIYVETALARQDL